MIEKLRSLFSSNKGIPSPQEKAKAVYFVLITQGETIIQDILSSSPEQFKDSHDFRIFLGNEIGVVMCLNSSREGYERFFRDSQERELFSATLLLLFKNHLQISWDTLEQYINLGESSEERNEEHDIIYIKLFGSRIVAFFNQDDDLFTNGEKILMKYSFSPEATTYATYYVRIFEMVTLILNKFAGESANNRKILKMSKKLDQYLK